MIIGSGMISSGFSKKEKDFLDCIIIGSGVSSSSETNPSLFEKEIELVEKIIKQNKDRLKIIYFSSILTPINKKPYYKHKFKIENLIQKNCKNYLIFRIPQIVGLGGNTNNFINYLRNSFEKNELITIYKNVYRVLIDLDDLIEIVFYCKNRKNNKLIIFSEIEKLSANQIYDITSKILNKKLPIKIEEKENEENWNFKNDELIEDCLKFLNIQKNDYTLKLLNKYIKK